MARFRHPLCGRLLVLCLVLSPGVDLLQRLSGSHASVLVNAQQQAGTTTLPLNEESLSKGLDAFKSLIDNTYDFRGKIGVPSEQLKSLGVPQQFIDAADKARKDFRVGLATAFGATNHTLGAIGSGGLLDSMLKSSTPIIPGANGQPLVPALTAIGKWMGDRLRESVQNQTGAGKPLDGLANIAKAGRKLMEVEDDEAPEGLDAVEAAEHDIKRIHKYLEHLAEITEEVFQAEDAAKESDATSDSEDSLAGAARKLQQQDDGSYLGGYATAFRFIFTNIFDWFRDFGLYGLVPIIADLRGFFTRYNWISDVLQIIAAPVENFINTNYYPLPQSNDDVIALVRKFFSDYCTYEKATSSEQTLGEFTGPSFTVELKPVSCPIYSDPVTGRNYISFADCDPAQLIITVTPLTVTEAYLSAATYTGTECKYSEVYGIDTNFAVGGGEQAFTFRRSAQGIDVVPTVIQVNSDLKFYNYEDQPVATLTDGGSVTLDRNVTINKPASGRNTATDETTITGTRATGPSSAG